MKRLLVLLTLLALLAIAIVPAFAQDCTDELGCVLVGSDDPIVIGTMLTTSGATSYLGEDSQGGVELAIFQRDGMLLGRDIEVVHEDSLCNAEGGQAAAQRIAADESVLGVVGTNCSGAAAAALPIISDAGLLMISPSNTSPFLTNDVEESGGIYLPGYFRTAHNDLFQGALAAQFSIEVLGAEKLATIHDGDPYTDGLQGAMADEFAELGGEVVFQGAISKGDTDMTAILTEIASNPPDILYYPLFQPEADFITVQAKQIPGLEDTVLMTADGSLVLGFVESVGDASLGMYQSGPSVAGEAYNEFLALWEEELGGQPPSGFHAHAYDATNILLDAIESVAVELDDGSVSIGRQALRDAVAATDGYEGLTGTLTCQDESPFKGDCATGEALAIYEITQDVLDGNWPPPIVWTPADAASE
jgi:branched-chain amino acid transport system substrate-binding protein